MWNHRVIELTSEEDWGDRWLEICEVYYQDDGSLLGYCKVTAGEESLEDLKEMLQRMSECLNKPILQQQDFHKQKEDTNE